MHKVTTEKSVPTEPLNHRILTIGCSSISRATADSVKGVQESQTRHLKHGSTRFEIQFAYLVLVAKETYDPQKGCIRKADDRPAKSLK